MLGCFRKHKTNIVACKHTPSDPCLLHQVTQDNLHLSAACSSPRAVALGALSALAHIPGSFLLAHRHTWTHHCQGSCALHLAHNHFPRLQKVTRGSLSLMLTLSIPCPLAAASADPAFAAVIMLDIFSHCLHPTSSLLLSPAWSVSQ